MRARVCMCNCFEYIVSSLEIERCLSCSSHHPCYLINGDYYSFTCAARLYVSRNYYPAFIMTSIN